MSRRAQTYHAGIPIFMQRPLVGTESLKPATIAVLRVPFDGTSGLRPGARWGPRGGRLGKRTDALYVWIDIDVVAGAYAPGTGGVLDGLEARQLFEAVAVLARAPVAALDLVEVAPNYDPAELTIRLAAQALFQFIVERAAALGPR